MKRVSKTSALLAGVMLAAPGCQSIDGDSNLSAARMLIPAKELVVSSSLTISAEAFVAAGLIYLIIDPLAPNWKVEVAPMGTRRYRLELTMKRFITGGEGESGAVIRRAGEKLRREGGFDEYAVLEHSESIESRVPIAQRVAHAVIELR